MISDIKTSAFAEFEEKEKDILTIVRIAEVTIPSQDILKMKLPDIQKTGGLLIMFNEEVVRIPGSTN